jgi:hypothetical protein
MYAYYWKLERKAIFLQKKGKVGRRGKRLKLRFRRG